MADEIRAAAEALHCILGCSFKCVVCADQCPIVYERPFPETAGLEISSHFIVGRDFVAQFSHARALFMLSGTIHKMRHVKGGFGL